MQMFINSADGSQWAFDPAVVATETAGVYAFKTANGTALNVPKTLTPGTVAPVAPPAPTPQQSARALIAGGLTIVSTGTPALNSVYSCDSGTVSHISSEMLAVLANGTFADGTTSVIWADAAGAPHTFPSIAAWKPFALAVAYFVAASMKVMGGTSTTLPSNTATIP